MHLLSAASIVLGATSVAAPAAIASTSSRSATAAAQGVSGPLTLASTSTAGVKANAAAEAPSISSSGDAVAFSSVATNLDPGDTDARNDVYVKDLTTGTLVLASTSDAGVKGNGDSAPASLDGDGGAVAFQSTSTNLDPGDTDNVFDIYVKDVTTGDITLASTSDTGVKANIGSRIPSLSRSGNRVAFHSEADNLDPADADTIADVYVKKLNTGDLVLASISRSGIKGDASSTNGQISPNDKRVAFQSFSDNMIAADPDHTLDVYVKILKSGKLLLASTSDSGVKGNGDSGEPSPSTKGTKIAFISSANNLDPADTDTSGDIYVKNLTTGDIVLASTSDTGVKSNGTNTEPALSPDGKRVAFFSTATNLDPADTSTDWDVYLKDLVTGDISVVSMSADGVKGNDTLGITSRLSTSGEGKSVAFMTTATNLDPNDPDSNEDIYVKQPLFCTIFGTSGDDTIDGTPGSDVICGRGGDDTIDAKGGDDVVFGEEGNDYLAGGPGADGLDGGSDGDTLDYSTSGNGVIVDLAAGTASGGDAEGDTFFRVENVQGSELIDSLTGDGGPNGLLGLGGDDILAGGGGGDLLLGLDGTDVIDYRTSPSAVTVDLAADTASGGDATGDVILQDEGVIGSAFADTLTGDAGDNFFVGMAGGDDIDGGAGIDLANYVFSGKGVTVNLSNGTVKGGDAAGDSLTGIENLGGSAFDDKLVGDDGPNELIGMAGDDTLTGKGGDDQLFGQEGTDTFDGGGGTDFCDNEAGESATHCEP